MNVNERMANNRRAVYASLVFLLFLSVLLLDQLAKSWVLQNLGDPIDLLGPYLQIIVFHNSGIAFGLPIPYPVLTIGILIILLFLVIHYRSALAAAQPIIIFPLALIYAGAVSNLIDRFRHQSVIDYLSIPLGSVFNLADLAVITGIIILFIHEIRRPAAPHQMTNSEKTLNL